MRKPLGASLGLYLLAGAVQAAPPRQAPPAAPALPAGSAPIAPGGPPQARPPQPTSPPIVVPPSPTRTDLTARPLPGLPVADPQAPRAAFAVHTGTGWNVLGGGNGLRVFRDNPPMTGVIDIAPGSFRDFSASDTRAEVWRGHSRYVTWYDVDLRVDGSAGRTFADPRNFDGVLGAAPVEGRSAPSIRWHAAGIQLRPGEEVPLKLQRSRLVGSSFVWQDVPGTNGTVLLDPSTIIVGVTLLVVTEPGGQRPFTDRSHAELWFDGRAIERIGEARLGPHLGVTVLDRDPRPRWTDAAFDDVSNGRNAGGLAQEIDSIWSACGRFGKNIQFRLVRYAEISAEVTGTNCAHAASRGQRGWMPNCVARWARSVRERSGDGPTVPIAMVLTYPTSGVAETWSEGIVAGQEIFSHYGNHTLAHELGHFLGFGSFVFEDGRLGAKNLMGGGLELTREQCEIAYAKAGSFAVR